MDFGNIFFKFQKGTIIILRPKKAILSEIIKLIEDSFDIIKDKKGLIIVRPRKIRIIKPEHHN